MKKLLKIVGAASLAIGLIAPAVAQDGPPRVERHTVVTSRTVVSTHRAGWHGHRRHKVCSTRWRHHHRIRSCHWE